MITQFPASNSLSYEEMASLLNRALLSVQYMSPLMNTKLGQVAPGSDFLRAGMIAYADGTNWNPLSDGVAGYMYYTGAAWKRLATSDLIPTAIPDGTADYKYFMNSAGNAKEWAVGLSIVGGSRWADANSGDVQYTGANFKPSMVFVLAGEDQSGRWFWGFSSGASVNRGVSNNQPVGTGTWRLNTAVLGEVYEGAGVGQYAVLKSFDVDGCTLTWTKEGSPGHNAILLTFIFFR